MKHNNYIKLGYEIWVINNVDQILMEKNIDYKINIH